MRRNPYEKIRKAILYVMIILLIAVVIVMAVMIAKKSHHANRNKIAESTAVTEKIENTQCTETEQELYFDSDGKLKERSTRESQTESEEDNVPEVRDVSPDNDPNAIFPDTPSDAQPAEQEQQGQ